MCWDIKVRNHCQFTGKYRGAAHRGYNINVSLNYKIRIVFHNLKILCYTYYYANSWKIRFKRKN